MVKREQMEPETTIWKTGVDCAREAGRTQLALSVFVIQSTSTDKRKRRFESETFSAAVIVNFFISFQLSLVCGRAGA
jgi:hypothetical protein